MKSYLLYICILGVVFNISSCKRSEMLPELKYSLVSAFTTYPDSTFFKNISCLYSENGKLYMFDPSRADVAILDIDKDTFYTVGKLGESPQEVISPTGFFVRKDTVYILDAGSMTLKLYDGDGFIKSLPVPACNEYRFFIENNTSYITMVSDSTCYVKTAESWERGENSGLQFCGELLSITDHADMNLLRNQRHLVKGKDCLYAICSNYPVVEKYDLYDNKLLSTYDLSDVDVIKDNLSYIKMKNISSKSFFTYLCDAYWHNDKLYLLCATWKDGYKVNTILILDSTLSLSNICHLPHTIYNTICVDDNYIYAMNYEKCAMEIYKVDKPF